MPTSAYKNRIKEVRIVPASSLIPNEKNWRRHGDVQRSVLRGILEEIGIAGVELAYETADGLKLIDGHLRREELGDQPVHVAILDVDENEADVLLATYDPITNLADADATALAALAESVSIDNKTLDVFLQKFASETDAKVSIGGDAEDGTTGDEDPADLEAGDASTDDMVEDRYGVIITCNSEHQQVELMERFEDEGLECRALIS